VQLRFGHFFGLSAIRRFQIDDRRLIRIEPPDQVNSTIYRDAAPESDLDLLFGELDLVELEAVRLDILAEHGLRRSVLIDRELPRPGLPFVKLHEAGHSSLPHQSQVYALIHDCLQTLDCSGLISGR
jgi:hypothetical protein